jgi:outer membrane protein assembly factor BamB
MSLRTRSVATVGALFALAAGVLVLANCLGPTEITLVLQTNVPCKHWDNATITVGTPADVEAKSPATATTICDAQGNLGTLVIIPSGSDTDTVAIKVVGGDDRDPNTCLAPKYGAGCIVARRQISYLKHAPLRLIVTLDSSCNGIECNAPLTCSAGKCVSDVVNPNACVASGCDASVLAPAEAGPVDAGTDAHMSIDAARMAPAVCGDMSGLQKAAPWPMRGYCPTHQGRSPFVGPQTPTLKWKGATMGTVSGLPAVGADGTVYVGSNDHNLYAFAPDGGTRWTFATGGNINNPAPAIGANGSLTVPCSDTNIYNVAADGGRRWAFSTGSDMTSSAAIGGSGTIFIGGGVAGSSGALPSSLLGLSLSDGGLLFSSLAGADVSTSPAIGVDGTVYFGSGDNKLYAISSTGTAKWSLSLGASVGSPTVGDDGTIYAVAGSTLSAVTPAGNVVWTDNIGSGTDVAIGADGTLYYIGPAADAGTGAFLHALSPTGAVRWVSAVGSRVDYPPSIGADGTVYVASFDSNIYAIAADGKLRWTFLTGGALNSAIALADHVLYVGSSDNNLYAIGP